jgi:hypothetical protein
MEFKMKNKFTVITKVFLPILLGSLGGYLYYALIGCNGSCLITSSPVRSTLYGFFFGLILTDWKTIKSLFNKKENKNEKEHGIG